MNLSFYFARLLHFVSYPFIEHYLHSLSFVCAKFLVQLFVCAKSCSCHFACAKFCSLPSACAKLCHLLMSILSCYVDHCLSLVLSSYLKRYFIILSVISHQSTVIVN